MAVDITTNGLISDMKAHGMLPDGMFSDSDLVDVVNDSFFKDMIPFILKHREDYFSKYKDFAYNNVLIIPHEAMGFKLKDVVRLSSDGNYLGNLPRLTIEEISGYNRGYYRPVGFYVENNAIKFFPSNTITDRIRVYYYSRPAFMELNSECSLVLSATGSACTVDAIPSTWTTATKIDVINSEPPYDPRDANNPTPTIDTVNNQTTDPTYFTIQTLDTVNNVITLSASGFSVGDYICPRGYTVYFPLPYEMREMLIQACMMRIMIALKDIQAYKLHKEQYEASMDNCALLISPRVDGEVKKIVNTSGIWNMNRFNRNNRGWW